MSIIIQKKKRVNEPTLDRTVSGKALADFAFPVTKIGKKGIPKENSFQIGTLDTNLISLQSKHTDDPKVKFDDDAKANDEERKKKPKKSRLGPILNPDDIDVERQVKISPEETKTIIVKNEEEKETAVENEKVNDEINEQEKPKIIDTGATVNLNDKLDALKKASGQDSIDQVTSPSGVLVDIQVDEVNIEKPRKKKREKENEKTFTLNEKTLKDDDDGKIIAVEVPDTIKNFGKSK